MATDRRDQPAPLSKSDRKHGYRIGCDGWVTVKDAAALMGCSDRTVERRIEAGAIRAYKLDPSAKGGVRICRRSIAEFIATREVTGPAA